MTPISLKFKSRALFFPRFFSSFFFRSFFPLSLFFLHRKIFFEQRWTWNGRKTSWVGKKISRPPKKIGGWFRLFGIGFEIPARKSWNQGWISELVKNWAAVRLVFYWNAIGKLSLLLVRSWTNPERFLLFCSSPRTFIVRTLGPLHLLWVRTDP